MITQRIEALTYQMQQLAGQIQMLQQSVNSLRVYVETEPKKPVGDDPAPETQVEEKATESRVKVIAQRCRGCGICATIAPNTFAINPWSGIAEVTNAAGDPPESIQMAVSRCPTGAIRYET